MNSKPLIFFLLLIFLAGTAAAQAPPPIPCEFQGTITIGGVPAPVGTVIQTKVYGTVRGTETTTQVGQYAFLSAQVTSDEYSCGCSIPVEFYVSGYKADQVSTFTAGAVKILNLTFGTAPTPTATPTSTPTASPTATPTASPTPTTSPTATPTTSPTATPTQRPTSIPSIPHTFYGSITLSGDQIPAPLGTIVLARVEGNITGPKNPVTVIVIGQYGGPGQFDQKLEVQGYIEEGAPVSFYADGVRAQCRDVNASSGWLDSYPFHAGGNTELALRTNMSQPVVDFAASPVSGTEPLIIEFFDLTSGSPTSWHWDFGDGGNSTLQNPAHRYYNGVYNVTLTASNVAGTGTLTRVRYINVQKASTGGGAIGGGGGGGGYYAPSGASNATATATPTPTATRATISGETLPLNSNLVLSQSVVIVSEDDIAAISMQAGMKPTTSSGEPLLNMTIRRVAAGDVPPYPAGFTFAGYAYDILPNGATFDPYITLSITVPEAEWSSLQGRDLSIKWYNTATSAWEDLPTTVNPGTRTVSAKITHTSIFALFATTPVSTPAVTAAQTAVPTTTAATGGLPALDTIIKIVIVIIIIAAIAFVVFYFIRKRRPPSDVPPDDWDISGLH